MEKKWSAYMRSGEQPEKLFFVPNWQTAGAKYRKKQGSSSPQRYVRCT